MRFTLLSSALLLVNCTSRKPAEWQGPPIVKLECPGVKSVTIVPTVHSYGGAIPPNIQAEVKAADVVFFEYDAKGAKEKLLELFRENRKKPLPKITKLSQNWVDEVDAPTRTRIEGILKRSGVSVAEIKAMEPEAGYSKVLQLATKEAWVDVSGIRDFAEDTFDDRVQRIAEKSGKQTVALETIEEFFVRYIAERNSYITDRIGSMEFALRANEIVTRKKTVPNDDFYKSLTMESIEGFREYAEVVMRDSSREDRWIQRLTAQLPGKRAVIAIGAGHVSVARGVPAQLVSKIGCSLVSQ